MSLLLDVFGFLTVILRGITISAQALTIGGVAFLLLLGWPFAAELGAAGDEIVRRSRRLLGWSALVLAAAELAFLAMQSSVLMDTADLTLGETLGADFAVASMGKIAASLAIAAIAFAAAGRRGRVLLVALALGVLLGSVATSHAVSRLGDPLPLATVEALHQIAAAVWIGGIPYFLIALHRVFDGEQWRRVGKRFSQMSMASVAVLLTAGLALAVVYIGSFDALYGTAYGVMVVTKAALFGGLLLLGAGNYLLIERLRRDPATPITRLKRFAEVEIGVGLTVLFCAASLTSLPPAVDLTTDRASWSEIAARIAPRWPVFTSPEHASLAIPMLQAELDNHAAAMRAARPEAFVPGAGVMPPRNAEDIAWSEYNHHWAGILVLAIGLLALAERSGKAPWARHWPLLFLVLAAFLFVRSDPEVWPLGEIGFVESFRDPEVVQHRIFVAVIIAFGLFEWSVRTGRVTSPRAALVFPLATAVGGALLLTHSHALSNVKDALLIEITHVPLALCGVTAGWARWLELRLPAPSNRFAAWAWPIAFVLVGLILLDYRES
jgi:putative copper resistance protein D